MSETPQSERIGRTDLSAEQQVALEELLFRLADDEFVHAERLTEWQIYAPTLESDLAIATIAQDEFGHARLWYDLLKELGYTEPECIWERDPTEWTHSPLVERPFEDGDWGDAIVRGYLYDVAERIRLEAVADTSYAPLADRVGKALEEEEYHREHAANWLERLTADDDGNARVQDALDELFPYALSLFQPGPREADIVDFGFRTETVAEMRTEWLETVVPFLESLDLNVPEPDEVERPDERGRDGTHTDAWDELYDEFTETYHEIGVETPATLRATEE